MRYFFLLFMLISSLAMAQPIDARQSAPDNLNKPNKPAAQAMSPADRLFIDAAIKTYGSRETAARMETARGWSLLRQGDIEVAVQSFTQAYLLDRNNAEVYWGLGVAMSQQGRHDTSVRLFARALKLDPQNPKLLADIGLAHARAAIGITQDPIEQAKRLQGAMPWFDAAEKLDPGYPATYANRAMALYYLGNYREAWLNVQKAEIIDRNSINQKLLSDLAQKLPRPTSAIPAPSPDTPVVTTEAVTAQPRVEQIDASEIPQQMQQEAQETRLPTALRPTRHDPASMPQSEVRQIVMPRVPRYLEEASVSEPRPVQESALPPMPSAAPISEPATIPAPRERRLQIIGGQPHNPAGPDKRNCLNLPTNEAIMRCVYPR